MSCTKYAAFEQAISLSRNRKWKKYKKRVREDNKLPKSATKEKNAAEPGNKGCTTFYVLINCQRQDYSRLGYEIKRDFSNFSTKISKGLKCSQEKFIYQMVFGILAANKLHLSETAHSLKENITFKKPLTVVLIPMIIIDIFWNTKSVLSSMPNRTERSFIMDRPVTS